MFDVVYFHAVIVLVLLLHKHTYTHTLNQFSRKSTRLNSINAQNTPPPCCCCCTYIYLRCSVTTVERIILAMNEEWYMYRMYATHISFTADHCGCACALSLSFSLSSCVWLRAFAAIQQTIDLNLNWKINLQCHDDDRLLRCHRRRRRSLWCSNSLADYWFYLLSIWRAYHSNI